MWSHNHIYVPMQYKICSPNYDYILIPNNYVVT